MKITKNNSIYIILWNTKKCGGNKVVIEYAKAFKEDGYDVKTFSVVGGDTRWLSNKIKILSILRIFQFKKPDILICTFWPTAYLACLVPAVSKYYFIQGWETDFYRNPLLKFLALKTLEIDLNKITISIFLKLKILSIQKSDIQIVPNGINLSIFKPMKQKIQRKELRIISVISSYKYAKGIDNLAEIVRKTKERTKDIFFTLVSYEHKPYSDNFDQFKSNVSTEDLAELYRSSDILLATSRSEGFFMPALEAMASGLIVVSTDNGGINQFGNNGKNCIIVKNYREIVNNGILEKLMKDSPYKKNLIRNGINTANKYSFRTSHKLLEKIIINHS